MNLFRVFYKWPNCGAKRRTRLRSCILNTLTQPRLALLALRPFIKHSINDSKGIAAVEFAMLTPILLILFLGGFEMTRYVLINQKISKTAASMSDLISRLPSVKESEISNSFNAVQHLIAPYYDSSKAKVIITSVMNDGISSKVNWQRCGGGSYSVTSAIGVQGAIATLPAGFTLAENEDTIIAEIFYDYDPIIAPDTVAAQLLSKTRFTKPRLGALITITDDAGVTGC